MITKGIGNKKGGTIKQSIGSYGKLKTNIGYNSGKLKNGWGYTLLVHIRKEMDLLIKHGVKVFSTTLKFKKNLITIH